jgi:hypothetical protein
MKRYAAFVLLLFTLGCGAHSVRHISTVSSVSAHASLIAVRDLADLAVCGKPTAPPAGFCVTEDVRDHKIAPILATGFDYDVAAAKAIRALPEGAPQPGEVAEYLAKIGGVVDQILALIPSSQQKSATLVALGGK